MELKRDRPARPVVLGALGAVVAMSASVLAVPQPVAARPISPVPAETLSRGALADPDASLGPDWAGSKDQLVAGAGDRSGFHLFVARERDAFAWSNLTTLNAGLPDVGNWTGSVCVTGSGKRAVAVYAPTSYSNKPELATKGAYVAVVDLTNGKVVPLKERVQLAYYNPSCGAGERVLVTRPTDVDQQTTEVIAIDAAAGKVTSTVRLAGQFTNAAPAAEGDYGILRGGLHRLRAGKLTKLADPGGQPFAVRVTAAGAVDVLTVDEAKPGVEARASAHRYDGRRHTVLGTGRATGLELVGLSGGRNALVGDIAGIRRHPADLVLLKAGDKTRVASREGHLLLMSASPAETGQADRRTRLDVTVRATRSGRESRHTVTTTPKAPADVAAPRAGRRQAPSAQITGEVITNPFFRPTCAVPRNDIRRQVLQPSANQVEWAVDLAVQGKLTVSRPANYLKTGGPAYTPQGLFPLPSGPRVPAQVMLAVLAQETNMAQASWHAAPGDGGNPLVSDYYGSRSSSSWGWDYIDYDSSDCGYGISQVTDGMTWDSTKWTEAERVAISSDYAANIAAGLRILVEKFNQVQSLGISVNTNDPRYIENWFLAVWGYNSGVHPQGEPGANGNYGLGWFNNPANPSYPANRTPFLRINTDDASHPSDWSYPERIMGWAEVPQWQWIDPVTKYSKPLFGSSSNQLSLPSRYQFCGAANNCSPFGDNSGCDESCWWHGSTSWASEAAPLSTEKLVYAVGSAEPAVKAVYPKRCTPFSASGALVVDDLKDSSINPLGCAGQSWGGKFTLRLGSPAGDGNSFYADIDVHQLGAGYLGHMWFTHSVDDSDAPLHQVVGTWTPNIRSGIKSWDIVVHLPSHGANETAAEYLIQPGIGIYNDPRDQERTCVVNQDSATQGADRWVSLGRHTLGPRARVQLSNRITGANGEVDIAWDAMAFVPATGTAKSCGTAW